MGQVHQDHQSFHHEQKSARTNDEKDVWGVGPIGTPMSIQETNTQTKPSSYNPQRTLVGHCQNGGRFQNKSDRVLSNLRQKRFEKEKNVGTTPCEFQWMMSIPTGRVRTVNLIFGGRKLSIQPHSNINEQDDLFQNTIAVLKGYNSSIERILFYELNFSK